MHGVEELSLEMSGIGSLLHYRRETIIQYDLDNSDSHTLKTVGCHSLNKEEDWWVANNINVH